MEKGLITFDVIIIAHQESAEVPKPGKSAFDFPAVAIAAQNPPVVEGRFAPAPAMRANQQDAPSPQAPAQWIAVVSTVGNDAQGLPAWAPTFLRHPNLRQGAFGQGYFSWRG